MPYQYVIPTCSGIWARTWNINIDVSTILTASSTIYIALDFMKVIFSWNVIKHENIWMLSLLVRICLHQTNFLSKQHCVDLNFTRGHHIQFAVTCTDTSGALQCQLSPLSQGKCITFYWHSSMYTAIPVRRAVSASFLQLQRAECKQG